MKNFKNIVLFKGWKAKSGPVHTIDITVSHIINCFFPQKGDEYSYLGYAYYYVKEDGRLTYSNQLELDFFKAVDKVARPWWCPKFILRLTHLFGNDNSIIRMRNSNIANLHTKITKGIMITDIKWKYDSFRIYGYFTKELDELAKELCNKMEDYYNDKNEE